MLYRTTARATGEGRNGHVTTTDGMLDVPVRMPPELGGKGGATNPEQLFAAGYAACFHQALLLVAGQQGTRVADSTVAVTVGLQALDHGGFGLDVELAVTAPDTSADALVPLVGMAHEVCPYSNATRGSLDVRVTANGAAVAPAQAQV